MMKILELKTAKRLLGNYGERVACRYLRRNGYRIERRNFVGDTHEIDIVASNKYTLIFVEVKTRTLGKENANEPRPASSVTPEKQRSIINAAKIYMAFHPTKKKKRFDIIEVYVKPDTRRKSAAEIKHLVNAFNANTAFSHRKD